MSTDALKEYCEQLRKYCDLTSFEAGLEGGKDRLEAEISRAEEAAKGVKIADNLGAVNRIKAEQTARRKQLEKLRAQIEETKKLIEQCTSVLSIQKKAVSEDFEKKFTELFDKKEAEIEVKIEQLKRIILGLQKLWEKMKAAHDKIDILHHFQIWSPILKDELHSDANFKKLLKKLESVNIELYLY